jgi:threonine dehydratase
VAGGAITTLADGIAVKRPGGSPAHRRRLVDDIVTVGEDDVADAMMFLMERAKLFVEGGGAVGVAALMSERVAPARTGVTAVVLSGWQRRPRRAPRPDPPRRDACRPRLLLFVRITDRPGGLARLLAVISEAQANVIEVEHVREGVDLHVRETGIRVAMEVRNREHAERIVTAVRDAGYSVSESR